MKISTKDIAMKISEPTAVQGMRWVKWEQQRFRKTLYPLIDWKEVRHVKRLSKDFLRSLRFHASL